MNVSDAAAGAAASATPALDEGGESASGANAALLALGGVPAEPLVVYVLAFAAVVTVIAVACILYRECAPSRAKPAEEPAAAPPPLTRPPSLLAALATGGGGGGGLSFADWYQQITCQTGASVLWSGMHARVAAVDRDAEAYKLEVPALGRTVDVPFYSTELTAATLSAAHLRF